MRHVEEDVKVTLKAIQSSLWKQTNNQRTHKYHNIHRYQVTHKQNFSTAQKQTLFLVWVTKAPPIFHTLPTSSVAICRSSLILQTSLSCRRESMWYGWARRTTYINCIQKCRYKMATPIPWNTNIEFAYCYGFGVKRPHCLQKLELDFLVIRGMVETKILAAANKYKYK